MSLEKSKKWVGWIDRVGYFQWMWVGYDECDEKVRLDKCDEWLNRVG